MLRTFIRQDDISGSIGAERQSLLMEHWVANGEKQARPIRPTTQLERSCQIFAKGDHYSLVLL